MKYFAVSSSLWILGLILVSNTSTAYGTPAHATAKRGQGPSTQAHALAHSLAAKSTSASMSASAARSKPLPLNLDTVAYYKDLLLRQKAGQVLHLEDFNRTFTSISALDPAQDRSLVCTDYVKIDGCQPDTYYSWGEHPKTETVAKQTLQAKFPRAMNRGHVYLNQSSIGSYCYGTEALRFKFKTHPTAGDLNEGIATYNEWTVGSNDDATDHSVEELESVSFGQPEHFDEIVTEIKLRLDESGPWNMAPLYVAVNGAPDLKTKLLSGCVPERNKPMIEETLVQNLSTLLEVVLENKGWIHYQNCASCTRDSHFATKWPSFFNPK